MSEQLDIFHMNFLLPITGCIEDSQILEKSFVPSFQAFVL
jgi:hypothetical protein